MLLVFLLSEDGSEGQTGHMTALDTGALILVSVWKRTRDA